MSAAGIIALILVVVVIIVLVLFAIFFFFPSEIGVTGFTGTMNDTISNLGNKLILYQPSGTVSGTPVITLGANNSSNTTGKQFIFRNNSNMNPSSNTVQLLPGGTGISNIPSGSTRVSVAPGTTAWFIFNAQNQLTYLGTVPSTFSSSS